MLVILTPSFRIQPALHSSGAPRTICNMARAAGAALIENDIYSELAIRRRRPPRLKQLDESGNTILMGSFSKISFPGMRVGWVVAPRPVIARLAELKQLADLHTDHLSQAFLLHFAESGELAATRQGRAAGKEKLRGVLDACRRFLPRLRLTLPSGGMNLWVELPAALTAVLSCAALPNRRGRLICPAVISRFRDPSIPRFPSQFRGSRRPRDSQRYRNSRRSAPSRTRFAYQRVTA